MERRISEGYTLLLVTVFFLFLPFGGYERMMEGKYHCFLILSIGYLLAVMRTGARRELRPHGAADLMALAYLAATVLSAALSPCGAAVLLGGTRRDGLLTVVLYVFCFLLLARYLRPGRRILYAAAWSAALCDLLVLIQLAGRNPLRLYPVGLNYFDGDSAYLGFYAGTAGNIDFTAFLLALCAAAMAAALVRGWSRRLFVPLMLTVWTLVRLQVAAALLGLAVTAVVSLPLLFPRRKRTMWALTELHLLLRGRAGAGFGSGRLGLWRALVPLIAEHPLLGGGCGTLYLRDVEPFYWYHGGETVHAAVTSAHNEYLGILLDQGVMGLAAFLTLLAYALFRAYRRAEDDRSAVAGTALVCYAVMTFFTPASCITGAYLWLLLAVLAGRSA